MNRISILALAMIMAACAQDTTEPQPVEDAELLIPMPEGGEDDLAPLASPDEIEFAIQSPVLDAMRVFAPPHAPFTVIDNIHHVGGASVSAYLITTDEGHFLIDGILPQSPPMILENIAALGYDIADVRYLLNSHAHIDHAGGLAALQQASDAVMVASEKDAPILEAGAIDFGPTSTMPFPPVRVDHIIQDGDQLTLGDTTLTAVVMPGHSPGCTSWLMDVTDEDGNPHQAFFHCSTSLGGQRIAPESYPGMVDDYRASFERVRSIDADVFLAFHSSMFGMLDRYERLLAGEELAFVEAGALQRFNDASEAQFNAALSRQQEEQDG
ncbi:subclass B3 metallo-beta-lactamase [Ponticaulis sp.]|uniref:subclass B3 metallo-beta-lactamase n=1 Tax=Ponticaulis sp. TaxID=2020902 RepID=UPI0025DEEA1A|nr:subclass B3 metallo-beta-lactamase [Ponticaulis sp.]